jgi:hypothetical protein
VSIDTWDPDNSNKDWTFSVIIYCIVLFSESQPMAKDIERAERYWSSDIENSKLSHFEFSTKLSDRKIDH